MDAKQTALTTVLVLGGFAVLVSSCSDSDDGHHAAAGTDKHAAAPAAAHHDAAHAPAAAHHADMMKAHTSAPARHHGGHHAVHWSYEGESAPWNWGSLKPEFSACDEGKSQSPIDISQVTISALPDIEFNYSESPLEIVNNGHTIQANYAPGSSMVVGGKQYELLQFHFHSPSENTIGGKAYDMVAHLVHKAEDGQLGVIAVMFKAGDKVNSTIGKLWLNMPEESGVTNQVPGVKINAADLLPPDMTYFNFSGSLTTPPCSEGVNWIVLATPQSVSTEQVKQFTHLFPLSTRPVQPLNGRVVRISN
ncbi:MAG TPA: carbonic anhydrase family protein [Candidatus Tenderia sp.]|nr:carbonic anhydrase family protein [Candidatus Tenderia sp.]